MTPSPTHPASQAGIRRTAAICAGVALGMAGLAFASVPLYDLFCRVTGFDGRPIVTTQNASRVLDRTVSVRFDANVAPGLNWRFSPEVSTVDLKVGELKTVLYRIRNEGSSPTTGIATFNVQPGIAGAYFAKVQCFCFTEQTLQPGETLESAVVFYIDPAMADDPNVRDLTQITLSYTYFPAKGGAPAASASVPARPNL